MPPHMARPGRSSAEQPPPTKQLSDAPRGEVLLVDISNSFVKLAIAQNGRIGRVHRLPTKTLNAAQVREITDGHHLKGTVAASVVPKKCRVVDSACGPGVCWV